MGDTSSAMYSANAVKEPVLFVGNLAPECDEEMLHHYIGSWVQVKEINIERYQANMRSIGYAFVHVADLDGAQLCILTLSGTTLFGKRLFIGWAHDARKILFGNLERCSKNDFMKLIHTLSKVQDIGMGTAGAGQVHFSVVTFQSHEDARRVMEYFKSEAGRRLPVCARWLFFFPCPWNSSFVRTRHPIEF